MKFRTSTYAVAALALALLFSFGSLGADADDRAKSKVKPNYPTSVAANKPLADDAKRPAAIYLTMSDGVKIACDVWLPKDYDRKAEEPVTLPTIMRMTRYVREFHVLNEGMAAMVLRDTGRGEGYTANGYAYVAVDARGSGASFGSREHPWTPREIKDYGEVADWISKQSWSNGRIGAVGVSYEGNTAEFIAANMHPAVKVVVPQYDEFDVYHQVAHPGGVFNDWFVKNWSAFNQILDSNDLNALAKRIGVPVEMLAAISSGIKPVDEDTDQKMRDAAVKEHAANANVYELAKSVEFRDQSATANGSDMDKLSPFNRRSDIEKSDVVIYGWASWLDAGTAEGALARFNTYKNLQQVVIGPWSHGGGANRSPLPGTQKDSLNGAAQSKAVMEFLNRFLKGSDAEIAKQREEFKPEVKYYVHGTGEWRTSSTWPPADHLKAASESAVDGREHWHFTPDQGLVHEPDPSNKRYQTKEVPYKVDFTATSGEGNRWHTQIGAQVNYKDRRLEDKKLLTFTQALDSDVEIIGSPVLTLTMKSDRTDGAVFAYLEMFDPKSGSSTYITEGMLRLKQRKAADPKTAPYHQFGTYHSFKKADALEVKKDEWMTFDITLNPTAVRIPAGMALRVAIGGHDAGTFQRYPESGDLTYTFRIGAPHTCGINLPIRHFPKKSDAKDETKEGEGKKDDEAKGKEAEKDAPAKE